LESGPKRSAHPKSRTRTVIAKVPELPEIEALRRSLAPELVGRRFESFWKSREPLRQPFSVSAWRKLIQGRTILEVRRRGKFLVLDCEGGGALLFHLGMSGRLRLLPQPAKPERHVHWRGWLEDGRELRLRDPRRFGLVWAGKAENLDRACPLGRLGPEPLDPPLNGQVLMCRAQGSRQQVKAWLLNGANVAGLGNIYVTEALHLAQIHPAKRVNQLTGSAWERLATAVVQVLEEAIRCGGTTLQDFQDGKGRPGSFQYRLLAYGRAGKPCFQCGAPLRDLRMGGRSSVYCANCQR
jgi:formamidopyrimidine-DNA glycosylase